MMSRALLVVDMQSGLVGEAHARDQFLARVLDLRGRARAASAMSVLVQHDGVEDLTPGSPPWQLHPALAVSQEDVVVRKRSVDPFVGTQLARLLAEHGVTEVVVAGYASEYCVDSTCRSALAHGYDVVLAADAHSTFERGAAAETGGLSAAQAIAHHNWVLATLKFHGRTLTVLPTAEIAFHVR
jgi:nicotinamidase-related amidase